MRFLKPVKVAEDAVWAEKEALTQKECDAIEKQFTTPYNTSLSKITKEITVDTGADVKTELKKAVREVTAQYSNGEEKTYSVRRNEAYLKKRIQTEREWNILCEEQLEVLHITQRQIHH